MLSVMICLALSRDQHLFECKLFWDQGRLERRVETRTILWVLPLFQPESFQGQEVFFIEFPDWRRLKAAMQMRSLIVDHLGAVE